MILEHSIIPVTVLLLVTEETAPHVAVFKKRMITVIYRVLLSPLFSYLCNKSTLF